MLLVMNHRRGAARTRTAVVAVPNVILSRPRREDLPADAGRDDDDVAADLQRRLCPEEHTRCPSPAHRHGHGLGRFGRPTRRIFAPERKAAFGAVIAT